MHYLLCKTTCLAQLTSGYYWKTNAFSVTHVVETPMLVLWPGC